MFVWSFTTLIKHVLQALDRFGSIYLHSSQTQNKSLVFSGPGWTQTEGLAAGADEERDANNVVS